MGIAGGEVAIGFRESWIFLYREEELWKRFVETSPEEVSGTGHVERPADPGAWTKPQ